MLVPCRDSYVETYEKSIIIEESTEHVYLSHCGALSLKISTTFHMSCPLPNRADRDQETGA